MNSHKRDFYLPKKLPLINQEFSIDLNPLFMSQINLKLSKHINKNRIKNLVENVKLVNKIPMTITINS
jgi:hypothetical protein